MGRPASPRPPSAAGKRLAEDKSAARWFDWQGAPGSPTSRPGTADVNSSVGSGRGAARAAAEAQANAARNGRAHNGVTSPDKTGLHAALRSNDQTDYKRRHGLDLRTTKVNHQWSHSGHFPGMPLPCWGQGCSKLWGCGHGVGDEELDRQLDMPEWEGRGNDSSVPEWLRYEGKIVNRKLSKRFVLTFCRHVWDYKYPPPLIIDINGVATEVKREPRHGGLSLAFHECMKTTYGPPRLVAGVAYNMYYGLLRFRKEHADLDIFCRILTDELPSGALFAYMEEVDKLRGLLRAADADKKERLSRSQVIEILKQRFGAVFDDAAARDARAAMDAEQPPLSVHPSWYLNPQNSRRAAKLNDVEYEKLIRSDRHADQGPFAQLTKSLIIKELRQREWPTSSGDVRRRKYDFNAWRKARVGAAVVAAAGYLAQAIDSGSAARGQPGDSSRAGYLTQAISSASAGRGEPGDFDREEYLSQAMTSASAAGGEPVESYREERLPGEAPGLWDRATVESPGQLDSVISSASAVRAESFVYYREEGPPGEAPGLREWATEEAPRLLNRAMSSTSPLPRGEPGRIDRVASLPEKAAGMRGSANGEGLGLLNRAMESRRAQPGLVTGAEGMSKRERDGLEIAETAETNGSAKEVVKAIIPLRETDSADLTAIWRSEPKPPLSAQSLERPAQAQERPGKEPGSETRPNVLTFGKVTASAHEAVGSSNRESTGSAVDR